MSNMKLMVVTLEVSKLSGWLNAASFCRESKGGNAVRGEVYGSAGGGQRRPRCKQRVGQGSTAHMGHGKGTVNMKLVVVKGVRRKQRAGCGSGRRLRAQGRRGAHPEHLVHVCDAGGIPVGNVRVETIQVLEEATHVGDGRDVPVGDVAVRCNGGSRVSVVGLDLRLQGGLGREDTGRGRRRARRGWR